MKNSNEHNKALLFHLKTFLVACSLALSATVFAQNPHADRLDASALNQQGQLVNLKLVPADRTLNIYVVGKKGAEINLKEATLTANLRNSGSFLKKLQVNKKDDHFTIPTDELNNRSQTHLELTTEVGKKSETFKINLK